MNVAQWVRIFALLAALGLAVIVAGAVVDQLKGTVTHG